MQFDERGTQAAQAARQAFADMETTWAQTLGDHRVAELRNMLTDILAARR